MESLLHISNYPKLIPILKNYLTYIDVNYIRNNKNLKFKHTYLTYYISNYNIKGIKVSRDKSLLSLYQYDFQNNEIFKTQGKTQGLKSLLKSLIWGLPNELKQSVIDATSLLHKRKKILENYIYYISQSQHIIPSTSSLGHFLNHYNINGKKVKICSPMSLKSYYRYDFRKGKDFKKWNDKEVAESLCLGVSKELKQEVKKAQSLLPVRIKILNNYVNYVENNPDIRLTQATLNSYCRTHNLASKKIKDNLVSKKVKEYPPKSMYTFTRFDFKNNCQFKMIGKTISQKKIFDSLTYEVPKDLKQKVQDAQSLLHIRKRILNNYVEYVEKNNPNSPIGLSNYLSDHSMRERVVKTNTKESLARFCLYDFRKSGYFEKRTSKDIFLSLTYNIKGPLVDKVKRYAFFEHNPSKLINRIEKNELLEEDYEHPLARTIFEELVLCKNNENRKNFFYHLRCKNNSIITNYLSLNEVSKKKIINSYSTFKKQEKRRPDDIIGLMRKQIHYYHQRNALGGKQK